MNDIYIEVDGDTRHIGTVKDLLGPFSSGSCQEEGFRNEMMEILHVAVEELKFGDEDRDEVVISVVLR